MEWAKTDCCFCCEMGRKNVSLWWCEQINNLVVFVICQMKKRTEHKKTDGALFVPGIVLYFVIGQAFQSTSVF